MNRRFVVAEMSKNWIGDQPAVVGGMLIAQSFEEIINYWSERGYKLHSFSLHRLATGTEFLNETIIAVFERSATDA